MMALHSPPALQYALHTFDQRGGTRYLIGDALIAGAIPVILTAATLGAGMSYGFQVYDNYQSGLRGPELWRANLSVGELAEGAFLGAVSGATAALVGAVLPAAGVGGWQGRCRRRGAGWAGSGPLRRGGRGPQHSLPL